MSPSKLETRVATPETLKDSVALIARIYQKNGYASPGEDSKISAWLMNPHTTTFSSLLEERLVGTISMIADSEDGLPMDSLFKDLLAPLREDSHLAEVGQFAIDREALLKNQNGTLDRTVSLSLFKQVIQTGFGQSVDFFCITVNPKHEAFYRFMGFEILGETRTYPSVENAPAVPMKLALAELQNQKEKGMYPNVIIRALLSE